MAYPFKPLSTEKLKDYFKKFIDRNCNAKETNLRNEKIAKMLRNKQFCPGRFLKTKGERYINS